VTLMSYCLHFLMKYWWRLTNYYAYFLIGHIVGIVCQSVCLFLCRLLTRELKGTGNGVNVYHDRSYRDANCGLVEVGFWLWVAQI